MNPLFYIAALIRFTLYPLRVLWSLLLYPVKSSLKKYKVSKANQTIAVYQEISNPRVLHLYIPGRNDKEFNQAPGFLNGLPSCHAIEILPPPCYQYTYSPFSIDSWAKAIEKRVEKTPKDTRVFIWGYSLGGLATGHAAKNLNSSRVHITIINAPKSLESIFYQNSALDIGLLSIHLIPAIITLLALGPSHSSLFLIAAILGATAFVNLICCQIYLNKERYYFKLVYNWRLRSIETLYQLPSNLKQYIFHTSIFPDYSIISNIFFLIPRIILKIISFVFLIFYSILYITAKIIIHTLHLASHIFSYFFLISMNSHQNIARELNQVAKKHADELLSHKINIVQATGDPVINQKSQLSESLKDHAKLNIIRIQERKHDYSSQEFLDVFQNIIDKNI